MSALPKFVGFKSKFNNKYLELDDSNGEFHEFIKFSGRMILTPFTKFEIQMADSDPNLVHIRCVHNNKYLVAGNQSSPWLAAAAAEPEEDRSKWNCTMFEPISAAGDDYRFRHVHLGNFARLMTMTNRFEMVLPLVANPDLTQSLDLFTVVNWDAFVTMPIHVAFKGQNDMFLRGSIVQNLEHLRFDQPDGRDPTAAHEVHMFPDGSIRIKSVHFNKFWRRGAGNWIFADTTDTTTNNIDTLFWPYKLQDNVIALRNLGNNMFCNLLTHDRREDCLNAGIGAMSGATELEVSELVRSRSVFNTTYHLMDARIYNEQAIVMGTGGVSNVTDHPSQFSVKITLIESRTSNWSVGVSLMTGVSTTFVGKVPFILEGKIHADLEFDRAFEFGRTHTWEVTKEDTFEITVPPRTSAIVRALATSATCDVPFSYTVTNNYWNGNSLTTTLDDGVYTGVNAYITHFEPEFTPLDLSKVYVASVPDAE